MAKTTLERKLDELTKDVISTLLLNGEKLLFTPASPEIRAFLDRVSQAAQDPSVSEQDLMRLVWGTANPLLNHSLVPGKAIATEETYRDPAFRLVLDLLNWKRIQGGTLSAEAAAGRYTLTVPQVAERLGIHQTSVRQAIKVGNLAAWKKGGAYLLDPASVESYRVSKRGRRAAFKNPLSVRYGTQGDFSLSVRWSSADGQAALANRAGSADGIVEGVVPQWDSVAVLTQVKSAGSYRCFLLNPRPAAVDYTDEIYFQGFYVRGQFLQQKINNSGEAMETWERFGKGAEI